MRSILRLGISFAAVGFSVVGACTFPDPAVDPASGDGGAPASTSTSIVASSSGTSTATGSTDSSSTTTTTTTDVGGGSSSSAGADGGGGSSSTDGGGGSDQGGGGSDEGGGGGTLTGVGGGVTDIACPAPFADCVPFPAHGAGGAGGGSGGSGGADNPDCDGDGDPNMTDCQPCDPLVYHDQVAYFATPFEPFEKEAAPSFDYDCSDASEYEFPYKQDGCSSLSNDECEDSDIFVSGSAPQCGSQQPKQSCSVQGLVLGACDDDGNAVSVTVRCH